jgi:hypothetical protein
MLLTVHPLVPMAGLLLKNDIIWVRSGCDSWHRRLTKYPWAD